MTRVTPHDVAEVLETELVEVELSAFIADANMVVDQRCAGHTDDEDALATVETYVAAHLATTKEPRVGSTSHESVDVDLDTDGNRYWHRAVLLDPTGRLATSPHGHTVATTTSSE